MRRRIVVDACVMGAIAFNEQTAAAWSQQLEGAELYAPTLMKYELASIARKKCQANPSQTRQIIQALDLTLDPRRRISWMDPNPTDVVVLANATGLSPYDASYLYLAGFLGADLLTADQQLAKSSCPFAGDENGQYLDDGFTDDVVV